MSISPGYRIHNPPHGFVLFKSVHGTDQSIVEAARVSYLAPSKGERADRKLLEHLYRNRHTSPFEQCSITFNIRMPIFCMRQFVRHRTFRLNEVSGRYTQLPEEFFIPEKWRMQNTEGNKQGSHAPLMPSDIFATWNNRNSEVAQGVYTAAYRAYEQLIAANVANEQARIVLPVGLYTEILVNCDLHNLMHFFRLRLDSHAQDEIRDIAAAMHEIASKLFPWTFDAFRKFKTVVYNSDESDAFVAPKAPQVQREP